MAGEAFGFEERLNLAREEHISRNLFRSHGCLEAERHQRNSCNRSFHLNLIFSLTARFAALRSRHKMASTMAACS